MRNKKLFFGMLCCLALTAITCKDPLKEMNKIGDPSQLTYLPVMDAREGIKASTVRPTVQTGDLLPTFEIVHVKTEDGSELDVSHMAYISISGATPVTYQVNASKQPVDKDGNKITSVQAYNTSKNGVISIAEGHTLSPGDYYFTIKVSTQSGDVHYSTVFEDAFHLHVKPLMPNRVIYAPKNQNLVYGDANAKTVVPIVPSGNPARHFALGSHGDKLVIDAETGEIALAPGYTYTEREVLSPVVHIVSDINGEIAEFTEVVTIVITDAPETMPIETIYFFYPTLNTSGAKPSSGNGFTVQTVEAGNATRIWGTRSNSQGGAFTKPDERPEANTGQTILETQTYSGSETQRHTSWLVTTPQDLTPFRYGYKISFHYYYMSSFVNYMADGRTPTDMEVYISTDYTGGDIQDAEGNWLNGTWTKVNEQMRRWDSTTRANSTGAPWGMTEFLGTPYPGDNVLTGSWAGKDPDGRKTGVNYYSRWLKCAYDISPDQVTTNFTVAFKLVSYFEGSVINNGDPLGRGGNYFFSDFHYKAVESN